jgi:hypothetical protein
VRVIIELLIVAENQLGRKRFTTQSAQWLAKAR